MSRKKLAIISVVSGAIGTICGIWSIVLKLSSPTRDTAAASEPDRQPSEGP